MANLAAIVLHVWSSRLHQLGQPDWCILDLDPKDAPFEDVIEIALAIRRLCRKIKLPCFVKTSGSSGLHVLLPLGGACTYEQSRSLGQLIAEIICRQLPEIATVTRNPERRGGKVYIDFVQNGRGRLLVAPFSVRPLPAAPVSTPLRWSEVKPGLDLRDHNIRTVPKRLKKLKADPLRGVLTKDARPAGRAAAPQRTRVERQNWSRNPARTRRLVWKATGRDSRRSGLAPCAAAATSRSGWPGPTRTGSR